MKFLFLLSTLAVSASAIADHHAYDYSKRFGIGGSFGYNTPIFGNLLNDMADGDISWGIHGRYHFNKADGIEFGHTRNELSDINSIYKSTDILYFRRLSPMSRFSPILGIGAGMIDISRYNPGTTKLGVKARVGAEYALNDNLSASFNVDYQHVNKMFFDANLPSRNAHLLSARFGLTYYFGTNQAAAAAPVAAVTATDSDRDGVIDRKDKCPNTPRGTKVNAYGCAVEEKATINIDVKFDLGKSSISSAYDQDLRELARFMEEHKSTKVEIQGHTDNTGSKALNKNLSNARAQSVKNYLVNNLGADAARLSANGFGDEMPISENTTEAGRKQNRRVVAVITQ